jgi:hypothetical protein
MALSLQRGNITVAAASGAIAKTRDDRQDA